MVLAGVSLAGGCAANVSKKYESDVRFERCYGLDWGGGVDPALRRKCWEEWSQYYSDGQPRDRVLFAKRQILGGSPAGLALASEIASAPSPAVPVPTSVFSPIPVMAQVAPTASATALASTASPPRIPCETKCDLTLESCLGGCGSAVCEGFCSQRHARCSSKCLASPAPKRR